MPIFTTTLASSSGTFFISHLPAHDASILLANQLNFPKYAHKLTVKRPSSWCHTVKVFVSGNTQINNLESGILEDPSASEEAARQARRSADWKAAKAYVDSGLIYEDIAKGLVGSLLSVKVIQADEDKRKLIFSEKEAAWSRFSEQVKVGDTFEAMVGSVEDYGAFVHLRFPDGLHHLTGLVHISEVSWDLVHDVRDILTEGDKVRVKVTAVDREKSRIRLSIKQLEEDPLLETLDKVIPQDGSADSDTSSVSDGSSIEPLPGLQTILDELLLEDGIDNARISRQGFEKRVVSQDLQLWLSNAPPTNRRFTLLARAGRQVQEIHLTTSLDQEGIKMALQRVLERVP